MIKTYTIAFLVMTLLFSCKDDDTEPEPQAESSIPAFYKSPSLGGPSFTKLAGALNNVNNPQDLDFHPSRENELWVINKGTDNSGGSTVTITNAGLSNQKEEWRRDENAWHFMALPSAISFSRDNDNFGTSANIQDANRNGGTFTGPTLWSSNMDVYAKDPGAGLNGSHLDMLHGSPYCMGIESDADNAFWVFDAYNGHICWYDFADDHGPGHDDHSDGVVYRYVELEVEREPNVPSHMVKDVSTGILFICDPAKSRVLWMNTLSGSIDKSLPLTNEVLVSHQEMKGLEWGVFSDINLQKPCGIEVIGNVLYVSDNETGEVIAYDKELKTELGRIDTGNEGITGLKADKNGQLWYVNADDNGVYRIDQN
ncbi:MAG: hypothetical protein COA58_12485 [Bacteroidetes bacterium]|nr:MAG: hypothetical protein COA58_12485 [Bacteroidota bacterium]